MKTTVKLCFLLLLIFICGCANKNDSELPPTQFTGQYPESTAATTITTYSTTPTKSDLSLGIDSGSYLLTHNDHLTGDYLEYYLFIPENALVNMPLVVFLHGDGEVGQPELLENYGMIRSARELYGNAFPFIAISPCTRVPSWTDGTIPKTLKGLIDQTVEDYSIDTNRIIITGHSRGAMGLWYMISTYGAYFSAAVPISCGASVQLDFVTCATVPILAFVGDTGEDEYRYRLAMERIIYCIHEAGGTAELHILEDTTHGKSTHVAFNAEVFTWMLEQ